ncbi:MAG: S-methyl-5-thioribose-1-phosphate isomerase [Thermodesulfobacteriota bacterium]
MFKTIEWVDKGVRMIDQRVLPTREVYKTFKGYKEVAGAIKDMVVRGAPAIGVAGAMGIALGASKISPKDFKTFSRDFRKIVKHVAGARPTAVNLAWAARRMEDVFEKNKDRPTEEIKKILIAEARKMHDEDVLINKKLGANGARLLKKNSTVLTHCNAGALATAGYGTALGVIRAAVEKGKNISVLADETRPFLQGARLTAWELKKDNIDVTLIADNMAGHLMKEGLVDAVVVGADRIASNGDAANKIGTYTVAVLAKEHKIPFYVAAPTSTIDMDIKTGAEIPIEERSTKEITHIGGKRLAPAGIKIKNPVFDVTPAKLITAIITEKGVAKKPFRAGIKALFAK